MKFPIPSNGLPFTILVDVTTKKPEYISIVAKDADPKMVNSYYISRNADIKYNKETGKYSREFELKFPQSPITMDFSIFNSKNKNYANDEDKSFEVTRFEAVDLKTYPLWADNDIYSFVEFAKFFCANAGVIQAGDYKPTVLRSNDGKFSIDYYKKIRNRQTGAFVSTPARVGHSSGIVDISQEDFVKYTIPMRMVILLHEFSHKYMNPKLGRAINDEVSADINALNIYLSLGYPDIEAEYAFLKVFRGANNEFNHKRYLILNDFIKKFAQGELENRPSNLSLSSARR